jgi:diaminopimelate decarboxylase
LKNSFNKKIKLYYAVKANSNLKILSYLKPFIDGLDVSSDGEIKQSILAGYDTSVLSFAGPGKTLSEAEFAVSKKCGSISIESSDDFDKIIKASRNSGIKPNLTVRINPLKLITKFAVKMGGKSTQFGIDEEQFGEISELIKKHSNEINFTGYHIYAGTQCLDADALNENFSYIFEMLERLISGYGLFPGKINLGGGFGIPYFKDQTELDIKKVSEHLNKCIEDYSPKFKCNEFIIELGRYLIGEYGYYLSKVLAVKKSRNKKYLVLDGGMHQNLSASGNLGQVIKKNYIMGIVGGNKPKEVYDIAGRLCTPIDSLGIGVELPEAEKDDLLVIYNSGAYGYTASPLLFLGHDTPLEVLIKEGKPELIRASRDLISFN